MVADGRPTAHDYSGNAASGFLVANKHDLSVPFFVREAKRLREREKGCREGRSFREIGQKGPEREIEREDDICLRRGGGQERGRGGTDA